MAHTPRTTVPIHIYARAGDGQLLEFGTIDITRADDAATIARKLEAFAVALAEEIKHPSGEES